MLFGGSEFDRLSEEVLERIRREQDEFSRVFDQRPQRLWEGAFVPPVSAKSHPHSAIVELSMARLEHRIPARICESPRGLRCQLQITGKLYYWEIFPLAAGV